MIYITGDTHGNFERFSSHIFHEQKGMTKDDYVIVCGDFGIWDTSKSQQHCLNWLDEKPFTTLFVDGNHENYDLLKTFPVSEWNGGKVQRIRKSVIHLMRGQVFALQGKKFFTMGGASSHDIRDGILDPDDPYFTQKRRQLDRQCGMYRISHVSWWAEELPGDAEYEDALRNLEKHDWKVDVILSHCCPTSVADIIGGGMFQPDRLTDFFEDVKDRCAFEHWFFGHYHENRIIMRKYILLFEQIVELPLSE